MDDKFKEGAKGRQRPSLKFKAGTGEIFWKFFWDGTDAKRRYGRSRVINGGGVDAGGASALRSALLADVLKARLADLTRRKRIRHPALRSLDQRQRTFKTLLLALRRYRLPCLLPSAQLQPIAKIPEPRHQPLPRLAPLVIDNPEYPPRPSSPLPSSRSTPRQQSAISRPLAAPSALRAPAYASPMSAKRP